MPWIWEFPDWPAFCYDAAPLAVPLADAASSLGRLHGRVAGMHSGDRDGAALAALMADVLQSSAIEGERLDVDAVRSSLARRLGIDVGGTARADRHVDGVVEMTLDATERAMEPLTVERLQAWQAALFPTGRSGLSRISVGAWRDDRDGPMQVVSGPIGKQAVHFEAPPAPRLQLEVDQFLAWFEGDATTHPLIRAGLAHLWFVTVHPFEDGNGRVTRAISDLVLSRHDGLRYRYYSLSAQLLAERDDYYAMLERTQRGGMDVTPWLAWFLRVLCCAVQRSEAELERVLAKALFWQRMAAVPLTERQAKALNRILDEFGSPVTNRKWAALTKVSRDTALRDLQALVNAGVLERLPGRGRSTAYWPVGVPRPGLGD